MSSNSAWHAISLHPSLNVKEYSLNAQQSTHMTLPGATTPSQSGPGIDSNKAYFASPKAPLLEPPPSYSWVSCLGHSLGEFYSSAEMQSAYYTAPADWTSICLCPIYKWNRSVWKAYVLDWNTRNHRTYITYAMLHCFNGISIFVIYSKPKPSL